MATLYNVVGSRKMEHLSIIGQVITAAAWSEIKVLDCREGLIQRQIARRSVISQATINWD